MRISDWSSDVCSSELCHRFPTRPDDRLVAGDGAGQCLPDRSLCLDVPAVEDVAAAVLRVSSPGAATVSLPLPALGEAETVTLWPHLDRKSTRLNSSH